MGTSVATLQEELRELQNAIRGMRATTTVPPQCSPPQPLDVDDSGKKATATLLGRKLDWRRVLALGVLALLVLGAVVAVAVVLGARGAGAAAAAAATATTTGSVPGAPASITPTPTTPTPPTPPS